jgi:hypothetical protein
VALLPQLSERNGFPKQGHEIGLSLVIIRIIEVGRLITAGMSLTFQAVGSNDLTALIQARFLPFGS